MDSARSESDKRNANELTYEELLARVRRLEAERDAEVDSELSLKIDKKKRKKKRKKKKKKKIATVVSGGLPGLGKRR